MCRLVGRREASIIDCKMTVAIIYCVLIALFSLLGGNLPLAGQVRHRRLQIYLSFSAGAMLGACFFHMLPHSAELAKESFGLWMAVGVLGLYVIERFLSPHSHATPGESEKNHSHHEADHDHPGTACLDCHPAAPTIAGWSAVAGLSIHTILGGVALGSAVLGKDAASELGLAVFLATILHKPADALTISALLLATGVPRARIFLVQLYFACLIPAGVLAFALGQNVLASHLDSHFTGCVLAFSAGTFLCIALSDLLPEVQFHSHDRSKLFAAVIAGALVMYATSLFEPEHPHGEQEGHAESVIHSETNTSNFNLKTNQ